MEFTSYFSLELSMVGLTDIVAILLTPGLCSAAQNEIWFVVKESKMIIFIFLL